MESIYFPNDEKSDSNSESDSSSESSSKTSKSGSSGSTNPFNSSDDWNDEEHYSCSPKSKHESEEHDEPLPEPEMVDDG